MYANSRIKLNRLSNVTYALLFSSPDPKGHVEVLPSLGVRRPSVNFSYFNLLL